MFLLDIITIILMLFAGAIIWMVARALFWLVELILPSKTKNSPVAPPVPARPATASPGVAAVANARTLERGELLTLFRKELFEAVNHNAISAAAFREVRDYVDREKVLAARSIPTFAKLLGAPVPKAPEPETLPLLDLIDKPMPAEPACAAPASATPVVTPAKAAFEDPDRIRAVYAKLHAHSQEAAAETPVKAPELTPAAASALRADVAAPAEMPSPQLRVAEKSLAERLFTPENVRILQSLGICIIFISTVAFVRTNVWAQASGFSQLGMLLAGTVLCTALGWVLRRWTSLRITGLGFLILGQLSLIVDTYAALFSAGTQGLYPFSPSSLWTLSFILFSASAAWQARSLKEPLFDAFTYFGALTAWGCGALWLNVNAWLLPAAFTPALLASRSLVDWFVSTAANRGGAVEPLRRWSLPWWLRSGFDIGTPLLALALLGAALVSGKLELARLLSWHCAGLILLASGFLVHAWRNGKCEYVHFAVALLLVPAPLAAYAREWPVAQWTLAFALPGSALAFTGLIGGMLFGMRANPAADSRAIFIVPPAMLSNAFAIWGALCAGGGLMLTLLVRMNGDLIPAMAWSAGACLATALAFAVFARALWAAWATVGTAAFLTALCFDLAGQSQEYWPMAWLVLSAVVFAVCNAARALARHDEGFGRHVAFSADALAVVAAGTLVVFTPIFSQPVIVSKALAWGWAALAGYALLTSLIQPSSARRATAVVLLSPGLVFGFYQAGFGFAQPAPYLAALALAVIALASFAERVEKRSLLGAALIGSSVILLHGTLLASWDLFNSEHAAAAGSFAALSGTAAALALRVRAGQAMAGFVPAAEFAALALLAAGALGQAAALGVTHPAWMSTLMLIGAGTIFVSMIGESVGSAFKSSAHLDGQPFRSAGEIAALFLCAGALVNLFTLDVNFYDQSVVLMATWTSALLPLFIALRPRRPSSINVALASGGMGALMLLVATWRALAAKFWDPACPAELRTACAVFFAVLLAASAMAMLLAARAKDNGARKVFCVTPATAMFGIFGLLGCAYGAFSKVLPPESFSLCCAVLACGAWSLAGWKRESSVWLDAGLAPALRFSAALAAGFGALQMLGGLFTWPTGTPQVYSCAAWMLIGAGIWFHAALNPRHTRRAALAGLSLSLAVCHALRWGAFEFAEFGPWLILAAAALLALRQAVFGFAPVDESAAPSEIIPEALHGRAGGLLWAALLTAAAGILLGLWGALEGYAWLWCVTLMETALCIAALSVISRRENAENLSPLRILGFELLAWMLVAFAVSAAAGRNAANVPLSGAWSLIGALFILLGMAGEALCGPVAKSKRANLPGLFLESRHVAAFALAGYNVVDALMLYDAEGVGLLWRALLSSAALAVYGSFARSSTNEEWTDGIRRLAAFAAYIVLLPAGYLCLLKAHSTGSSWGALYFMALSPVLLVAAYVQERDGQRAQAGSAKFGAVFVSAGALVLSFAVNREHLAAVPALTFGAIGLQALMLRAWTHERIMTTIAGAAFAAAGLYAIRAAAGFPAWGAPNPWAWEMACLAAAGLVVAAAGAVFNLERGTLGRSQVAGIGACLSTAALGVCAVQLFMYGQAAQYLSPMNTARLDAFIVCLLVSAGVSLLARRTLGFEAGRFTAPVELISAYFLCVWKEHPLAWEWYSLPAAVFLCAWAAQMAREQRKAGEHDEGEVSLFLTLASALAVIPSFIQALPGFDSPSPHFFVLLGVSLLMVIGAMLARRKIPLLFATGAIVIGTLVQAIEWAQHERVLLPVAGIVIGFAVLALGTLFESRMNHAFRQALDRARAEARMFWVSWQ